MKTDNESFFGFQIPLEVPMRGVTSRRGILVKGSAGWGEYSPFPGFSDGLETLCWRAALAQANSDPPPALRVSIPVYATVPAVTPEEARTLVIGSGCTSAKVKVAEDEDEQRVEAVRDALGDGGEITVDANGGWTIDEAERSLKRLRAYGVTLAEQPVKTLEEMAVLRKRVEIPIAADESVRGLEDALEALRLEAADVLVVKLQHFGGITGALRILEATGLPVIVSSLIETSIGLAGAAAFAASLPELPFPCGLGTGSLLTADLVDDPLLPEQGWIPVRRPEVNLDLLSEYRYEVDFPQAAGRQPSSC